MPNTIHILDNGTRSKLRSTQIITSLPQIVSELVQNALDAGAKNVEVGVDHEEWGCFVRDDGCGINKGGLEVLARGVEGGRYASSKAYNVSSLEGVETFGFRGEALASISDLAQVEISTKVRWGRETWSVILKGGKKLYHGPSTYNRREHAGTFVTVRDVFYSVPIRRNSHPSASRTLDIIRRELETFAIVFPEVNFSLEDSSKERRNGKGKGKVAQVPKTGSTLATFRLLFGKAIVEHVEEIEETREGMKILGFASLVGVHTKAYQFLYINKHILDPCDLHRLIDQHFSASSFGKHAFDETGETKSPRPATRRSPRKSERRPVYVLNLHIPPRELDNCLEPSKSSMHVQNQDAVASFLADVIHKFLVKHGFVQEAQTRRKKRPRNESPTKGKRRNVAQEVDESELEIQQGQINLPVTRPHTADDVNIIVDENTNNGEDIIWTDPMTHKTYLIDARTGNSYLRSNGGRPTESTSVGTVSTKKLLKSRTNVDATSEGEKEMPGWMRDALEANNVYAATERPIPVLSLASAGTSTETHSGRSRGARHTNCHNHFNWKDFESSNPAAGLSRGLLLDAVVVQQVDRKFIACLIDAQSPVQECEPTTIPTTSSTPSSSASSSRTLYLVDQHAADERIRVEKFLRELCIGFLDCVRGGVGVEKRLLEPSMPVLVRRGEAEVLRSGEFESEKGKEVREAFRRWGFDVRLKDVESEEGMGEDGEYTQVFFESVPEVVADKLLANSAQDLTELVRAYLARLQFEGDGMVRSLRPNSDLLLPERKGSCRDEFGWLKALRYCPRELVELVNSKACRGAIMFNDSLTMDQCGRLVRRLADCAFPFICAHGRPSIVPLVRPGDFGQGNHDQGRPVNWANLSQSMTDSQDPVLGSQLAYSHFY